MSLTVDVFFGLFGALLAVFIFSWVAFGSNRFFFIAQSIYIGGTTAYGLLATYSSLMSSGITPLSTSLWLIIPIIIGFLVFARFTKYRWLARYPVAIMAAAGLGVAVGSSIQSQIVAQISAAISDTTKGISYGAGQDYISPYVMLVASICVITYFLYSTKYSNTFHKGSLHWITKFARIWIMLAFGYLFSVDFISFVPTNLISWLTIEYQTIQLDVNTLVGHPVMVVGVIVTQAILAVLALKI